MAKSTISMAILHILPMKSAIFHGTQCITTVSWRRLEVALLPAHCADGTHGLQRVFSMDIPRNTMIVTINGYRSSSRVS
jgi:hypothetical protein